MLFPHTTIILVIWFISIALFYWIIKTAVANGVREANFKLLESIRRIEDDVNHIKTKKESN